MSLEGQKHHWTNLGSLPELDTKGNVISCTVSKKVFSLQQYYSWWSLTVSVLDEMSQVERAAGLSEWSARIQPRLSSPSPGLPSLSELQCLRGGSLFLPFLYDRSRNTKHNKSSVSLPIYTLPPYSHSTPMEPVYMSIMTELSPRQAFGCQVKEWKPENTLAFLPFDPFPIILYNFWGFLQDKWL